MRSGRLNRICQIQFKSVEIDPDFKTEIEHWLKKATVWCEKVDSLPSRSEAVKNGLDVNTNQSRIRIPFRTDIDTTMRMIIEGHTYQIVAGPSEIGHKDLTEFVVERYSS